MTIRDIIVRYSKELEEISSTPRLDVETLLQKVLNVDRLYILLNLDKSLSKEEENLFNKFIEERLNNRPIAYIVGNREFMGLDFYVQEGVLIPRPDTEVLVEEVIEIAKNKEDINLFTNINKEMKFYIIVSNPPYIKREVIDTLDKQVKDFEPYNALEGGIDGLDFYRAITKEAKNFIKEGGTLAYEVGHDQSEDVSKLMKMYGYTNIYTRKDLQQIDRVVIGNIL